MTYHMDDNDNSFVDEAINIAMYFDTGRDSQLSEKFMGMILSGY